MQCFAFCFLGPFVASVNCEHDVHRSDVQRELSFDDAVPGVTITDHESPQPLLAIMQAIHGTPAGAFYHELCGGTI